MGMTEGLLQRRLIEDQKREESGCWEVDKGKRNRNLKFPAFHTPKTMLVAKGLPRLGQE